MSISEITQFLTAEEIAKRLRTSTAMIYEWQRNGTIPVGVAVKIGRRTLFNSARFEEWIANGGTASPSNDELKKAA